MKLRVTLLAIGLLLLSGGLPAYAAVLQQGTLAAWNTATAGDTITTVTFSETGIIPVGDNDSAGLWESSTGLDVGGANFTGYAGSTWDLRAFSGLGYTWATSGAFLRGPFGISSGRYLAITLPANVVGIAFDSGILSGDFLNGEGIQFQVNTASGTTTTATLATSSSGYSFFGFTSDAPINSIFLFPQDFNRIVIDNIRFAGQNEPPPPPPVGTPEISVQLMCLSGLMLAAARFRRMRRQPVSI